MCCMQTAKHSKESKVKHAKPFHSTLTQIRDMYLTSQDKPIPGLKYEVIETALPHLLPIVPYPWKSWSEHNPWLSHVDAININLETKPRSDLGYTTNCLVPRIIVPNTGTHFHNHEEGARASLTIIVSIIYTELLSGIAKVPSRTTLPSLIS